MTEKKIKKPAVDWEALEPHYRANIKSLKELGQEYGCSDAAIVKHAKKHGWTRNLAAKIAAKAEAKVSAAAVSPEVSARKAANQEVVVEANADLQFRVRMAHRTDIGRARSLFGKLLAELEIVTDNKELYEQLGELLDESGPDSNGTWRKDKINEIYRKVISLSGRVSDAKSLSDMLERVVKLERQAFGIDGEQQASPLDEVLKRIAEERKGSQ
jgi:hypothetical protein